MLLPLAVIMIFPFGPLLYFPLYESSKFQGTIGKIVMRVKITTFRGETISFLRSCFRGVFLLAMLTVTGYLCSIDSNKVGGILSQLELVSYTYIRSPFERVFSQANKQLRYIGIAKNQFAEFMNAICFNLKRLTVIAA